MLIKREILGWVVLAVFLLGAMLLMPPQDDVQASTVSGLRAKN